MKSLGFRQTCLTVVLVVLSLSAGGCTDEFYLSEKEVRAYSNVLLNESSANLHFDNLQNRTITIHFDNSSGTPRVQSTNLLTEMRRTEMTQLEAGPAPISLVNLSVELEKQISKWIEGRLQLYTSTVNDVARLERLESVTVRFHNNPTFTYRPERQSIEFDVRMRIDMGCTVEVNAVSWLVNLFTNINGTYPLAIEILDMRLRGEASVISPYANVGRVRFQLIPELIPVTIPGPVPVGLTVRVLESGPSVPDEVQNGVAEVLKLNLTRRVDETFFQDYDYFSLPQITISSSTVPSPGRLEVTYRAKTNPLSPAESTNPMLHVVTRGSDGKLYHARKDAGAWGPYNLLPFPSPSPTPYPTINGDPALFYSGAGQMELAATNENGDLLYAHWRDETWGNFQIIRPNTTVTPTVRYRGKPALVASAPGQVEIFVSGSDGRLWHLRRTNGGFQPPIAVPASGLSFTAPFRDPVAVHVGNKIVVVCVDSQSRLGAIPFDLENNMWGQRSLFLNPAGTPTTISHAPAAVASGEEYMDVVYVETWGSGRHARIWVSPQSLTLSMSPETNLGGMLTSTPVLVASGFKQLEVIARSSNHLYHNHFVNALAPFTVDDLNINPGWQGWFQQTNGMNQNVSATGSTADGRVLAFDGAATPTGRVEVVMRGYVTGGATQRIFHNNFESDRFGRAPWKTVHWRGYELSGLPTAAGRPAVVAMDRNFQTSFVGSLGDPPVARSLNDARLSASNVTGFLVGMRARAALFMPDPVILTSGPGIIDNIYTGEDGRLHHYRRHSQGSGWDNLLPMPNGVTFHGDLAADSYGNGFIDLAARGSDGCIYHWRYRDQASHTWGSPTGVACNVASPPALTYTGAGHLELLAVDSDYKLFRWRNLGTGWLPRLSIPSSFRVNADLFGQPATSSWGDGTVDVVVVRLDTRELHHRRVGPDDEICTSTLPFPFGCPPLRGFSNLGGSVEAKPVITAFSPTNLNVLTMRGLQWYSNWASAEFLQPFPPRRDPLIRWSGFQYIGGSEMVIGGAANAGRKNYAAVAIHLNGRIFINRYQDGRWAGFQPLVGQTPEMILRSPVILPAIASHGG